MAVRRLTAVSRTQGNNAALKAGEVGVHGVELAFEEVPVLVHGFRRMVRELAYDVCEMAATTYLCARAHGVPFTALPVFLVRGLHHDKIVRHAGAGIHAPVDLEGRRVGVHRGYTVTTGVWARGILADEHGVDLGRVIWLRSGDEHVAEYRPPDNVEDLPEGDDLPALVSRGTVPAAVNLDVEDAQVVPLLPDPEAAATAALRERGFYPINHLVVVRDELLADEPDLAVRLFEAFAAAKRRYVESLMAGEVDAPTASDRLHRKVLEVTGDDPLPYGIAPNRAMLDTLIRYAREQAIISETPQVDELFAPATRDLIA